MMAMLWLLLAVLQLSLFVIIAKAKKTHGVKTFCKWRCADKNNFCHTDGYSLPE